MRLRRSRHKSARLPFVVLLLCCCAALADDISTQRVVLHPGEQRRIAVGHPLDSVVVVDPSVAQATSDPTGYTLHAGRVGSTTVNVFDSTGLSVVVVAVEPTPPTPRTESSNPLLDGDLALLGGPTTLWGINRYHVDAELSSTTGDYLAHSLSFSGRLHQGTYRAQLGVLQASDTRLQDALVSWTDARQENLYELGDTGVTVTGSRLAAGLGMRGLHVHTGPSSFNNDFFVGFLRLADHDFEAPVAGERLASRILLAPDRRLDLASGLVAFSLPDGHGGPARQGLLFGGESRYQGAHHLYAQVAFALSAANGDSTSQDLLGTEVQSEVGYQDKAVRAKVGYTANSDHFFVPQNAREALPQRQLQAAASYTRKDGLSVSGLAAHQWLTGFDGKDYQGESYALMGRAPLDAKTQLSGYASLSSIVVPLRVLGYSSVLTLDQRTVGASATHTFDPGTLGQLDATFRQQRQSTGHQDAVSVMSTFQKTKNRHWQLGVNGGVTLLRGSTLAEDQAPLAVQTHVGVQGTLVKSFLQATGGFSLENQVSPTPDTGAAINIGLVVAPTLAHRLSASVNVQRTLGSGTWSEAGSINYTYTFGDSVHAEPLFEFMRHGEVHGRVCVDANKDGVCAPNEPAVGNILLRLSNGQVTRTDGEGRYAFEGLKPGYYSLEVEESDLRRLGRLDRASEQSFELKSRETEEVSFGIVEGCRVDGWASNDLNLDGQAGSNEPRLAHVGVSIQAPDGPHATTTDGVGAFSVSLKTCGALSVSLDAGSLPSSFRTGDPVQLHANAGESPTVTLVATAIRTVQGTVFVDLDGDGKRGPGEPPVGGARVMFGQGSVTTDAAGRYLLRHLPAGPLSLKVAPEGLPAGLVPGPEKTLPLPTGPHRAQDVDLPVLRQDRS